MILDEPLQPTPPWATAAAWQEANHSIDDHVHRYHGKLQSALAMAHKARSLLESIFLLLDEICRETCPWCPEPCCLVASPWYDFRDLVFLHLNGLAVPPAQAIDALKATCRYSGPRGCTLPRMIRPWICTWYVCPVQSRKLRKADNGRWELLGRALAGIKAARRQMEEGFIQTVSCKTHITLN